MQKYHQGSTLGLGRGRKGAQVPGIGGEGEFGQGKPELAVYRHALEKLGVEPADAWMVGDNYEWEVVAPQSLGICGIWYDPFDAGIPAHATAKPSRVIKRLAELVE